jgi:hypothetical protein
MPGQSESKSSAVVPVVTAAITTAGTVAVAWFGVIQQDKAEISSLREQLDADKQTLSTLGDQLNDSDRAIAMLTEQLAGLGRAPVAKTWKVEFALEDQEGDPVSDAYVALAPPAYEGLTGSNGRYTFNNVPSGTYTLLVSTRVENLPLRNMLDAGDGLENRQDRLENLIYNYRLVSEEGQ